MPEGAPTSAFGERSGAPSGLRPSSFVMCNTPVEVQFMTSAGCLNYPCRTPIAAASAAVLALTPTAFAQQPSQYGTADEAKAMLLKAVAAVKAGKTKALDMF